MKNFAKSILNYFAGFNETRFRFSSKLPYEWSNDSFTLDYTVFLSFQKQLLDSVSLGALLADEVGLGKTIEAGLVLSQKWAERKRRILVITPSNLRKQWYQELQEKFFLPCHILETRSYNDAVKQGILRPFEPKDTIATCSYQFAQNKAY